MQVQVLPWTVLGPKPASFVLNSLHAEERARLAYQGALFTVIFPNSTVFLGKMLKVDNLYITICNIPRNDQN